MSRIKVCGTSEYDVVIRNGSLSYAGELLMEELGGEKALIVSDSNVAALYLNELTEAVRDGGYDTTTIVMPAGEQTKDMESYSFLLNVMAEKELSKTDIVIALGGGVIGDLAGFAAATYRRGIRCVQMPSSLLAAVDSSVGGKNAINLPAAKNQVGTITNPAMVICDPELIRTLPEEHKRDGYAEIIKYGILNGEAIIDQLREAIETEDYEAVIRTAVEIKRDVVEMDEGDSSFRQYLNLGHLIGHALEAACDYNISHGRAVAEGLIREARACAFSGYIEMSMFLKIEALVGEFGFEPPEICDMSGEDLLEKLIPFLLRDKRIRKGVIQIIVPEQMGACTMRELSADELENFVRAGF